MPHLKELGLKAANKSSLDDSERTRVESGEYSLVYGSPEAWLKNERWRLDELCIFQKTLCHCSRCSACCKTVVSV